MMRYCYVLFIITAFLSACNTPNTIDPTATPTIDIYQAVVAAISIPSDQPAKNFSLQEIYGLKTDRLFVYSFDIPNEKGIGVISGWYDQKQRLFMSKGGTASILPVSGKPTLNFYKINNEDFFIVYSYIPPESAGYTIKAFLKNGDVNYFNTTPSIQTLLIPTNNPIIKVQNLDQNGTIINEYTP